MPQKSQRDDICVAQGVSPGAVNNPLFSSPPPRSAANGGGTRRGGRGVISNPRADTLRYAHTAPLGLKNLIPKSRCITMSYIAL